MKVTLICRSFDKNSGQGIYKIASYLYENLRKYSKINILKIEGRKINPFYFDLIESPFRVIKEKSDVFHFLMPEVSLSILLSKRIRERSVVTIHDAIIYKIKERKWLSEKYIKLMYDVGKKAKLIITPSYQSKNDLISLAKFPEEKISIIHWGVDLVSFKKLKKEKNDGRIVAGYVGGLGKRKNLEWIIKAANLFKEFTFKIAGSGPMLKKLLQNKNYLGLKNVEFLGFVPEKQLPKFYSSLDVFIFPSSYEGFGIPLLEAMSCEVPYIIGTVTGISEILPIYKINSFEQLKVLLEKIKKDELKPLRNQRKWIKENNFTWSSVIKKLVKIYELIKE